MSTHTMMTRKALAKETEHKLKIALLELKKYKEDHSQLLKDRIDSEEEIKYVNDKVSQLKAQLTELHIEHMDILDRLQEEVRSYSSCDDTYMRQLSCIMELETSLSEAQSKITTLEESIQSLSSAANHDLFSEVIGGKDEDDKGLPVVPKCCPSGQNLTVVMDEDGNTKTICARTTLTFQPMFHQANETHIFSYDSNVYETIVGNPCKYEKYKLQPDVYSKDEFYLLVNGSLFVPYSQPPLLGTRDYCMETFWNDSVPAGITPPVVCFTTPPEEIKRSATLIVYATGLLISVPFLLATACVYLCITELRDTHGKALACHTVCLALAFTCLAATQLAGRAFPTVACNIMAYLIQFSFVSCFFWLNVMCFDTFLNVRRYINSSVSRRSMRRRFAWYCLYAILLPLLLLVITITMDLSPSVPSTYLKPNFGVKGCWFKTDQAALPYFYGPVALILLSNLVIFILTSRAFVVHYDELKDVTPLDLTHSDFSTSDDWVRLGTVLGQPLPVHEQTASPPREAPVNFNQRLKKYKKIFRMCCLLCFIMGLSWVLEVVSWAAGAGDSAVSVWSVFDLVNALQGVVIFSIFVLQQPVRSLVKQSKLFSSCKRKTDGSEVSVVSERNSIMAAGRRDYV